MELDLKMCPYLERGVVNYYGINLTLTSIIFQGCLQKLEDNLEPVGIAVGVIAIIFAVIEVG